MQANEQDEKQNEEYRRRARRLATNRRSFENDSGMKQNQSKSFHLFDINSIYGLESERSKLDPLPEEKTAPTPTSSFATHDTYKRVYPDWKPSTTLDVVGTIEAIEDAQPRTPRDKSAWRKSNLNVPNSSETTDSFLRLSRQRSREGISSTTSSPLQSIIEEDRRKNVIQQLGDRSASDRLQIYIRRPSDSPEVDVKSPTISSGSDAVTSDHHSIYIRPSNDIPPITTQPTSILDTPNAPRRSRKLTTSGTDDSMNNKIEIDSDNIETPPSTRRNISTDNKVLSNPCRKLQTPRPLHKQTLDDNSKRREEEEVENNNVVAEPETLGQFDRHSIARRTRRYKRPTDYSSGNEERGDGKPDTSAEKDAKKYSTKSKLEDDLDKITLPKIEDKDARLKRWQERLKSLDKEENPKLSPIQVLSRVGKVGRNISSINQEDVREAIRNLKSPTETPERVWSPPRDILHSKSIPTKSMNHELNDEGFEETQSLVSDTPSHGKDSTSSNNEPTDVKRIRPLRMTSSDSAATTSSDTSRKKTIAKPYVQSLLERNRQSLERSRSLRIAAAPTPIRTALVKRTNSLRKTDSQSSVTNHNRRDVERSSSRTSLRSSRSSLNSAASTNTVKNVPLKSQRSPVSIDKSVYKKPLVLQNNSTISRITSRTPSRSSSSGSSIGPTVRRPPAKNSSSSISTSFKENQTTNKPTRNVVRSSSVTSSRLTSPPISNQISSAAAKVTSRLSTPTQSTIGNGKIQRVSNFMRPTTASTTKFSGAKGK